MGPGAYMLWFNITLGTIWYFPLFWCMVICYNVIMKQRKVPNCTKGNIEPQHIQ